MDLHVDLSSAFRRRGRVRVRFRYANAALRMRARLGSPGELGRRAEKPSPTQGFQGVFARSRENLLGG